DLTARAGHRVLMTFGAALRVVHGTQTVGNLVALFERRACDVEVGLAEKSVGLVVERRRRLGRSALSFENRCERSEERRRRGEERRHHQRMWPFHTACLPCAWAVDETPDDGGFGGQRLDRKSVV